LWPLRDLDLADQIETEQQNDQKEKEWSYGHGFSIIDKKSPRRGRRAEPQSTGLRRQTRRKRASQSLGRSHLSSCYFSQAFKDRHFTQRELLFDIPPRRFFQNGNESAQGVIAQHRAPGDPRNRFGLGNFHRAASLVSPSKCSLG
jgi:hypothetical protein